MSLATRLQQLRLRKGDSLQQVVDAIGVSKTHLWALEKGRAANPSLEVLIKLADHFEVSVQFLVGEELESSSDEHLVRMFRQIDDMSERDRKIVEDVIESLRRRRAN